MHSCPAVQPRRRISNLRPFTLTEPHLFAPTGPACSCQPACVYLLCRRGHTNRHRAAVRRHARPCSTVSSPGAHAGAAGSHRRAAGPGAVCCAGAAAAGQRWRQRWSPAGRTQPTAGSGRRMLWRHPAAAFRIQAERAAAVCDEPLQPAAGSGRAAAGGRMAGRWFDQLMLPLRPCQYCCLLQRASLSAPPQPFHLPQALPGQLCCLCSRLWWPTPSCGRPCLKAAPAATARCSGCALRRGHASFCWEQVGGSSGRLPLLLLTQHTAHQSGHQ